MNFKKVPSVLCVICILSSTLLAAEQLEGNIVSFGCNNEDGVCIVELNSERAAQSECAANKLQFNVVKDKNGDANFSLLTAAFFANKKVRFVLKDDCQNAGDMSTFTHAQVLN